MGQSRKAGEHQSGGRHVKMARRGRLRSGRLRGAVMAFAHGLLSTHCAVTQIERDEGPVLGHCCRFRSRQNRSVMELVSGHRAQSSRMTCFRFVGRLGRAHGSFLWRRRHEVSRGGEVLRRRSGGVSRAADRAGPREVVRGGCDAARGIGASHRCATGPGRARTRNEPSPVSRSGGRG